MAIGAEGSLSGRRNAGTRTPGSIPPSRPASDDSPTYFEVDVTSVFENGE